MLYSVPIDNPRGPATVFCDRWFEDLDGEWELEGVGTLPHSSSYWPGAIPDGTVQPLVGTPDQWLNGLDYATYIAGGYTNPNGCAPIDTPFKWYINQDQLIAYGTRRGWRIAQAQSANPAGHLVKSVTYRQASACTWGPASVTAPYHVRQVQQARPAEYISLTESYRQVQRVAWAPAIVRTESVAQVQAVTYQLEDGVLLYSNDFTNASTVNATGLSGYAWYFLVGWNIRSNGGTMPALWMRTSSNGGSTYDSGGSDYQQSGGVGADSKLVLLASLPSNGAAGNLCQFTLWMPGLAGTSIQKVIHGQVLSDIGGGCTVNSFAGTRLSTSIIDAIRLLSNSGNLDGSLRVYGYN